MKGKLSGIWKFFRENKYLVVTLIFIAVVGFLDQNNIVRRMQQKNQIKALESEIQGYQKQIDDGMRMLQELDSDSLLKEHMAREKYHMHRADEDVFME